MIVRSMGRVLAAVGLVVAGLAGSVMPASAVTPPVCQVTDVYAIAGASNGAAGTIYRVLEIVNHSAHACRLSGTPVSRPGTFNSTTMVFKTVGPASQPRHMTGRGVAVTIASHAKASVVLAVTQAANYQPAACVAKPVNAVQVTFAVSGQHVRLIYKLGSTKVCTRFSSTGIEGIALGITAP